MLNILPFSPNSILLFEGIVPFRMKIKGQKDLLLLPIFRLIKTLKTMYAKNITTISMNKILYLRRLKLEEFKANMKNYI